MHQNERIRAVSNWTGIAMPDIRNAMEIMGTDDPCLGAGYAEADGWAIAVKGDRVEFNKTRAPVNAERIRKHFGW